LRDRSRAKLGDEVTRLLPVRCLRGLALHLRGSDGIANLSPLPRRAEDQSDKRLAPLAIAGSQLHYRDNHDRYVHTFISDGRYRFASVHQSRTWADSREGHRPRSRGLTAKEHQT
jgi:hypothetical protein